MALGTAVKSGTAVNPTIAFKLSTFRTTQASDVTNTSEATAVAGAMGSHRALPLSGESEADMKSFRFHSVDNDSVV